MQSLIDDIPFYPHDARILCTEVGPESHTTEAGIIIPGKADDQVVQMRVVAVGAGELNDYTGELIPMQCVPGDVIWVRKNNLTDNVTHRAKLYYIIDKKHMLGRVTPWVYEDEDEQE